MYNARPEVSFIFVIDTESYAGNFERDMCAYCTGEIGECRVGEELATQAKSDFGMEEDDDGPFSEKIISRPDERGCNRPVSIFPTPYRKNGMPVQKSHFTSSLPLTLLLFSFPKNQPSKMFFC